jgi:WD40 repeat protein
LWEVPGGTLRATLTGHEAQVFGVAFDAKGELLASGSWDGSIRLWDVAKERELRTLTR